MKNKVNNLNPKQLITGFQSKIKKYQDKLEVVTIKYHKLSKQEKTPKNLKETSKLSYRIDSLKDKINLYNQLVLKVEEGIYIKNITKKELVETNKTLKMINEEEGILLKNKFTGKINVLKNKLEPLTVKYNTYALKEQSSLRKNLKKASKFSYKILDLEIKIVQLEDLIKLIDAKEYEKLDLFTKIKNILKKTFKPEKIIRYVNKEESIIIREELNKKILRLNNKLNVISDRYIKYGRVIQQNKGTYQNSTFQISRSIERFKTKIQRVKIDLLKLDEGKYERLNRYQKFKKYFSTISYQDQKVIFGILFLVPWIIGFAIFFASPMITTIWWSLNKMSLVEGGGYSYQFIGIENFSALFSSKTLAGSTILEVLTKSLINILINLPTILIFSLFIAVLLNTKFKGHQLVKAIFFIPVVYNMSVINNTLTGTFGTLFDSNLDEGFVLSQQFSNFLMQIGVGNGLVEFLTSAVDRIFNIVNMSGIQIIIFIAALQSIPAHLYEAAKVEGATRYEMFWKITIPMVSPMILTAVVFTIVDSFATSDIMKFMTVNSQGTTMATNEPGLYSAISIIYFLANALIILFIFALMRKVVFYNDK